MNSRAAIKIDVPMLFNLALKMLLSELGKHPHTVFVRAVKALAGEGPIPSELPWLARMALKLMASEAKRRPHTLLAYAIEQLAELVLKRVTDRGGTDFTPEEQEMLEALDIPVTIAREALGRAAVDSPASRVE